MRELVVSVQALFGQKLLIAFSALKLAIFWMRPFSVSTQRTHEIRCEWTLFAFVDHLLFVFKYVTLSEPS